MSGLFARLRPRWALRGWSDGQRALVSLGSGEQRDLAPAWFHVAESCDGRTDLESFAFTPYHRTILRTLVELGLAEVCAEGEGIGEEQLYREAPNPRISGLHWSVTGRCNLRCRHCYIEGPSGRYGELPLEGMLRLIGQFREANLPKVVLTGGEPLARADLPEIVGGLAGAGVAVCAVYTNGHLVDRRTAGLFRGSGFDPLFQVSLDGVGFHDAMRGVAGSEARVVEAIRTLRADGVRVTVSTCLGRGGLGCIGATYDLLQGLGIEGWGISVPREAGNWRGSGDGPTLEEEAAAYEPVLRRWLEGGRPFALQLGGLYKGPAGGGAYPEPSFTPETHDCATCREIPALLPDGTFLPCPGYVGTTLEGRMPNLLAESLTAVWSGGVLRRWVDRTKADLLRANPACRGCPHFADCGMGCRAMALDTTGDPDSLDPRACRTWSGGLGDRFRGIAAGA